MTTPARLMLGLVAVIAVVVIGGCGGSGGSGSIPANSVARVGNTPITKASLDHWMSSVAGEDLFAHVGKKAPLGLVSDPPSYGLCVSATRRLVPKAAGGSPVLSDAQLSSRCRQLYTAIKEQAVSQLILFEWGNGEGAEQGVDPSHAEVEGLLQRTRAEQFPKPGQFRSYLSQKDWTVSDELTQLRHQLISMKLEEKFRQQHTSPNWQREFGELLEANAKRWRAKTSCRAGYVVPECKEHKGSRTFSVTSPAILLENLAAGR